MDTVVKIWVLFVILGVVSCSQQAAPEAPKAERHHEPLCMDPFQSTDMGSHSYNWCKLVPMWSTKA